MLHTSLGDVANHHFVEKVSFFLMCDTAMLRSMQIQDPDNRVSDPTDLAVKPDGNRFRIMMGFVIKC